MLAYITNKTWKCPPSVVPSCALTHAVQIRYKWKLARDTEKKRTISSGNDPDEDRPKRRRSSGRDP